FSAGGAFGLAAGVCALEKQKIPPTINYEVKDPACDLNYTANQARAAKVRHALINTFGPSGCNASLVISKYNA
ncbi:MAG: beta-ketoacyl-[acyl-carrier-protein] synthase II, partial [Candidatus Omnitrophica bacterium]|nr:beta-ketoacyl-[acyl-carrier-protein] synthase II [Candidatus Omnitrophota bacterium]